ncbi:copper amine oxidase N-terminal domain-containing protein [Cohnella massiliensis]|uniref:copper amine oxidase N-terminal domain-containing protein n=1 Tax=Cohnella massiliensis TaxID=1816691 RepID=UPI0009BB3A47|nr:copper amine oxidase N-terminal domain-containing protein [Cohnella massiliensis]
MKRYFIVLLSALLFLTFIQVGNAATVSLPDKSKVFLKAGKFYILYTKPAPPFVDENNRLLVPLRAFEDLFGGDVSYSATTKTAQLSWLGHEFAFVIGSKSAQMDGQEVVMDTTPALKNGAMFLPIRIFLDQANLESHWDDKENVLILDDDKILTGEPFKNFDGNDLSSENEDGAFRINDYTIKSNGNGTFKLTINATNITGETIPEGKADIHPLVSFGASYGGFATDSYSRPVYPAIKEIAENGTVSVSQNFPLKEVDYIITVARLFTE